MQSFHQGTGCHGELTDVVLVCGEDASGNEMSWAAFLASHPFSWRLHRRTSCCCVPNNLLFGAVGESHRGAAF